MASETVSPVSTFYGFIRKHGRNTLIPTLIALVGSLLTACHSVTPGVSELPQPFSCARFGFSHWEEFNFGHDSTLERLFVTVNRIYQVKHDQIQVESYHKGQFLEATWTHNEIDYIAKFAIQEMILLNLDVKWRRGQPTLAQLVDCLGLPFSSHEEANDEGPESASISYYWARETDQEWGTMPGFVKAFMIEGVSSLPAETSGQGNQSENRISQLSVGAMPTPRKAIESAGASSCRKLSLSRWKEFRFGVDTQDDVIAAVVRVWTMNRDHVQVGEIVTEQFPTVSWNDAEGEVSHWAYFPDGHLGKIRVYYNPALAVSQVLDCLGPPEYYVSSGGPEEQGTSLSLWYVKRGFVVGGVAWRPWGWQKPLKEIPSDFGMDSLNVVPKGFAQMARFFDFQDDEGNPIMCIFRPWPGSIEAVEIREEPFLECYHSDTD